MTKLRIQGAFQRLILAASVAAFCMVALAPALAHARNSAPATQPGGAAILMADGTDPVPPPPPMPWREATA
jgi:hypothetical protein